MYKHSLCYNVAARPIIQKLQTSKPDTRITRKIEPITQLQLLEKLSKEKHKRKEREHLD